MSTRELEQVEVMGRVAKGDRKRSMPLPYSVELSPRETFVAAVSAVGRKG